mmetsp:Transcript_42781/g.91783  ORF Transcript_42781/g.91783 Transcript_42781/m.91783 type:complete len:236 (-) Transcript_42781:62-769(-)
MGRSESRGSRSPSRSRRKGGGGSGGRETGTVNTWNTDKQFGFVSCTSSNRADLFLHAEYFDSVDHRNRVKTRGLRRGDRIEFTIEDVPGKKSAQAMHADLLESSRRSPSSSRSRSRGRRAPPPPRPRAQIEFRPGDWDCPSCHFHNFARNSNCMKCDTSKDGDRRGGSRGGGGGGGGRRSRDSRSRRRSPSRRRSSTRDRKRTPPRRGGGGGSRSRSRSGSRRPATRGGSRSQSR